VDFSDPQLLFDKRWDVTVDTIQFTNLDGSFKIEKTLKAAPNNCELTIFNLTPAHRAQLEQLSAKSKTATGRIACKIDAGYAAGMTQVWLGDLRTAQTTREGPDWVTRISSGDGEKAGNARLHVSYGPKTSISDAFRAIARAMGVAEGNLSKIASKLKIAGSAVFPTGITLSGPCYRQLQILAQSADLQLSVQDGALQFQDIGKALAGSALELKSGTGMIDPAPTVDNEGVITVTTQMIPGIRMGGVIVVDGLTVKGQFKVEKGTCSGDTNGDEWGWTLQGHRY
jgi:hypothetical protein